MNLEQRLLQLERRLAYLETRLKEEDDRVEMAVQTMLNAVQADRLKDDNRR